MTIRVGENPLPKSNKPGFKKSEGQILLEEMIEEARKHSRDDIIGMVKSKIAFNEYILDSLDSYGK